MTFNAVQLQATDPINGEGAYSVYCGDFHVGYIHDRFSRYYLAEDTHGQIYDHHFDSPQRAANHLAATFEKDQLAHGRREPVHHNGLHYGDVLDIGTGRISLDDRDNPLPSRYPSRARAVQALLTNDRHTRHAAGQ